MNYIEKKLQINRKKLEVERIRLIQKVSNILLSIKEKYRIKEAYIVGSLLSKNRWYEFSDIDIAISGCSKHILEIMGDIEKEVNKDIDVIDLDNHPLPMGFRRKGKKVYG